MPKRFALGLERFQRAIDGRRAGKATPRFDLMCVRYAARLLVAMHDRAPPIQGASDEILVCQLVGLRHSRIVSYVFVTNRELSHGTALKTGDGHQRRCIRELRHSRDNQAN